VPDQPLPSRSPREGLDPAGPRPVATPEPEPTDVLSDAPPVSIVTSRVPGVPGVPATGNGGGPPPEEPPSGRGDGGGDDGDDGDASGDELKAPEQPKAKPRNRVRTAIEWGLVIGGALLVALIVRTFFIQAFWIPSDSMEPTLHKGDRVLVNKLSYDLHDVHRGDIVVFKRPAKAERGEDDIEDLIKRVIGLPGDTIQTVDGVIHINGKPLPEPYLPEGTRSDSPPVQKQVVPKDHYFVMGDNRGNSQDSRFFGPITGKLIVGRAFVRIYPLNDIGGL
jgi:signal peptidase I